MVASSSVWDRHLKDAPAGCAFMTYEEGKRPIFGDETFHQEILFNEYYHGDNGKGLGASHQTGWTALIAKLIQQSGGQI